MQYFFIEHFITQFFFSCEIITYFVGYSQLLFKTLKKTLNYQIMVLIGAEDTALCLAHHIINAFVGMQK